MTDTTETKPQPVIGIDRSRIPLLAEREEEFALALKVDSSRKALNALRDRLRAEVEQHPDVIAANAAAEAAHAAWISSKRAILEWEEDDTPVRCALSGVVLLQGDEVIEDQETGEKMLRCLVLPPRSVEEEDDDGFD